MLPNQYLLPWHDNPTFFPHASNTIMSWLQCSFAATEYKYVTQQKRDSKNFSGMF